MTTPDSKDRVALLERAKTFLAARDTAWARYLDSWETNQIAIWLADFAEAEGEGLREWQPIVTAPKDGTEVLLYRPSVQCERKVFTGNIITGCGWANGKWNSEGAICSSGYEPTHWMPIPDPPTDALREKVNQAREGEE